MYRWTAFFLILLRLAIGWHFLVEGGQKVQSIYLVGPTASGKPPFSSATYFRQAPGPLGSAVRRLEGDPDDAALARLVVPPLGVDEDPATAKPQDRVPPGLRRDWEDYLARFQKHYELDDEQAARAKDKLRQAEAAVVTWLTYLPPADPEVRAKDTQFAAMTTEQTRTFPRGEVKRRMSMAERITEYRARLADLRDTRRNKLWAFGKDVEGKRLAEKAAAVNKLRTGLLGDLGEQTAKFEKDLEGLLSPEQKEKGAVPQPQRTDVIEFVDLVTPWMLVAIGAGLLLGLFSRILAAAGAFFLLMTYLAVPALPWLPAPPASEGTYLFVNKNVIEMLALCALACAPTGRWFGLDAILHCIWRAIWPSKPQRAPAVIAPAA